MKKVLHVGCGVPNPLKLHAIFRNEEWEELRLDINVNAKPDIVGDIRDMPMVADNSVDAIWSSHNIEHLYPHEVNVALKEFLRVLKPGGFALIACPDIEPVAQFIVEGKLMEPMYDSPAGPICPIDVLYGFRPALARGNMFMAHHTCFTRKSLKDAFADAGFVKPKVKPEEGYQLLGVAYKPE